jgi:hypothetical protein
MAFEPDDIGKLAKRGIGNRKYHFSKRSITMSSNVEFIAYCLEEYKAAQGMTGKEVITLFKKHNIIDYIVSCYGALHTMGGLAIAEDIHSLIEDIEKKEQ